MAFWHRRRTSFKPVGLKIDHHLLDHHPRFCAPQHFVAPPYIDSRPYCLESNQQGSSPHCVGFTVAGYIEVHRWRETRKPEQIDGHKIYNEAKKIDGDNAAGTHLESGVKAAINLGYLPKGSEFKTIATLQDVRFALHKHTVLIGAFRVTEGWNHVDIKSGFIDESKNSFTNYHAALICYYNDREESVGWQNSWGHRWAVKGFGRMSQKEFDRQFECGVVIE